MTNAKQKPEPKIRTRTSGKLVGPGMFDRVKLRPEAHPIAEIIAGREPPANPEPLPISEPLMKSEPLSESARATPSVFPQPPLQTERVTNSEGVLILPKNAAHLRFPYLVLDNILSTLKPGPRAVCERLYRLSAGFDSDECVVSIGKLASACNIGATQVRQYLRELEGKRLIRRLGDEIADKNLDARGIKFKVLLPRMPPAQSRTGSELARGSVSEPIKLNTQKEVTQTQVGASVGSRFSLEDCRRYADHLKQTGQGITNPGGYATKIFRSGEADALIEQSLKPQIDISKCPDCSGSGNVYIDFKDPDKGVKRCTHSKLIAS